MRRCAVIIPCRNEVTAIPLLIREIDHAASEWGTETSVLVVDDGSRDGTRESVQGLAAELCRVGFDVRIVTLATHSGKDAAILCGLHEVGHEVDWIAIMDGDGQHPVHVLRRLVESSKDQPYVVVAEPKKARGSSYFRTRSHDLARAFLSRETIQSDFSIFQAELAPDIMAMMTSGDAYRDALTWLAVPVTSIQYEVANRLDGSKSRFSFSSFVGLGSRRALSRGREIVVALTLLRLAVILLCGFAALILAAQDALSLPAIVGLVMVLLLVMAASEVFSVFVTLSVYARTTPRPRYRLKRDVDAK